MELESLPLFSLQASVEPSLLQHVISISAIHYILNPLMLSFIYPSLLFYLFIFFPFQCPESVRALVIKCHILMPSNKVS